MITMAHYDLWVWLLVCPFSEVILYSHWRSGANVLSVVRSIEVVRISEVENTLYIYMEIAVGATACVRYLEVVRFSEGPLIEVLLYITIAVPNYTEE